MDAIEELVGGGGGTGGGDDVSRYFRTATAHDAVLNSECCYTFHTPYTSDAGIVVNLSAFMGTCQEMSMLSHRPGDRAAFVRIVKKRVEKKKKKQTTTSSDAPDDEPQPTKLGIGVDGGFPSEADKYETVSRHSVVVLEKRNDGEPPEVISELPYEEETKSSFPAAVTAAVDAVLTHSSLTTTQAVEVWQLDTDGTIPVSKYAADLPVEDNGVVIDPDPSSWKCQKSGDSENLWLNLSTGYIGGGRRNWDGSGGSNGALDHYEETGRRYPLVVKLGTITSNLDTADCYSYAADEDGPVRIPNLADLLQKRGINIASMQKTVKSTAELEVELNANYAFDAITEAGSELREVSGPGLQGLQNTGNSCYMNSVLQLLLSGTVPELAVRYGVGAPPGSQSNKSIRTGITDHPFLVAAADARSAPDDLLCQAAKVGCALTSGAFAKPVDDGDVPTEEKKTGGLIDSPDPKYRVAPRMFKHVIGKDHAEFRTGQQQDAAAFLQHMLTGLDRAELARANKTGDSAAATAEWHPASWLFSFRTTDRLVCGADGGIKYRDGAAAETIWTLNLPMDKAVVVVEDNKENDRREGDSADTSIASPEQKRQKSEESEKDQKTSAGAADGKGNKGEGKKPVPTLSFAACVEHWASPHQVDGIRWSHLGNERHSAVQQTRFNNFPRYLLVQAQRYTWSPDWTPLKLEVNLDIPHEIDLTAYRSTGPKEGENIVPEDGDENAGATGIAAPAAAAQPLDEAALSQLMDMGFCLNSCKRALTAVGGSDIEAAMNWVFEHNNDPDFSDPLPESSASGAAPAVVAGDPMIVDAATARVDVVAVDEGVVESLVSTLGCFTSEQVRAALRACSGAADRAADWLFSHMDDLDGAIAALQDSSGGTGGTAAAAATTTPRIPLDDGPGTYRMIGMVSHIGQNTGSGHYVTHLWRDGRWIILNDEKVAVSSHPPTQHAYLYLFQRTDTWQKVPHAKY